MSSNDVTRSHVCLLWGGWADERDVSHSSAVAVQGALAEAGFESVDLVDAADPELGVRLSTGAYDVAFIAMHGKYGEDGCIQGMLEVLHIPYTFSGVVASATAADKDLAKLVYRDAGIPCPLASAWRAVRRSTPRPWWPGWDSPSSLSRCSTAPATASPA